MVALDVRFSGRIALPFFRLYMQQNRAILIFHEFQHLDELRNIMPVYRTEIFKAERFENTSGSERRFQSINDSRSGKMNAIACMLPNGVFNFADGWICNNFIEI